MVQTDTDYRYRVEWFIHDGRNGHNSYRRSDLTKVPKHEAPAAPKAEVGSFYEYMKIKERSST